MCRFYSVFAILSYKYSLESEPHVSLLIELDFNPLVISERLGHDNVNITLGTYAHLYPNKQDDVAKCLEDLK